MTISPYDNLPVAGRREDEEAMQYIDVPVEEIEEAEEPISEISAPPEVSPSEPAPPEPAPAPEAERFLT